MDSLSLDGLGDNLVSSEAGKEIPKHLPPVYYGNFRYDSSVKCLIDRKRL